MDVLCDEFWNSSISWNTDDPELSSCFKRTILVWVPCFYLWLFVPVEIYYLQISKERNIPWSWLNILKCIFSVILIIEQILWLIFSITLDDAEVADYLAPSLFLISFLLQLAFILWEKRNGFTSSGYLFIFWALVFVCGLFGYVSQIMEVVDEGGGSDSTEFILSMIYYPLVVVMLFLNCFSDESPKVKANPGGTRPSPELDSSFPSRLTFAWLRKLIWKSYKKPVVQDDLWDLLDECTSSRIINDFDHFWDIRLKEKMGSNHKSSGKGNSDAEQNVKLSILPVLARQFGMEFAFAALLKLIHDLLVFAPSILLNYIIAFIENPDENEWHGYMYCVALLVATELQSLFLSQYFYIVFNVGLKVRTAIISAIYRKALRISSAAKKDFTTGEIVNLMAVDAQRIMDLIPYLNLLWSAPLQIIVSIVFLWLVLGPSVLSGLCVMVLLIPINGFIANYMKKYQIIQMKEKDSRVKLMSEVLNGMKVLKLYSWEPSFEEKISGIRKKEMKVLKIMGYINAFITFIFSFSPYLITFFLFFTYVMTGSDHVLTPDIVFVSISLLNILRMPLNVLPFLMVGLVQVNVSLKRMNKYLNAEELDPNSVKKESKTNLGGYPIQIKNGTFTWDKKDENSTLKDIDFKIKEGTLVGVVGSVGVGKSSLCSAILGEMDKLSGQVTISDSISYVPQQAWIQNTTLEGNILFGQKKDEKLYNKVVEACALKDDFDMLPAGDQTEIGEKGINLSGGQKQRVSLARALYANSDVYLFDDPLSAVDVHVGSHIFEQVLGSKGLLKDKTRMLVTHSIKYLPKMDDIIVMKDGRISEQGNYDELIDQEGEFKKVLLEYLKDEEGEEEDDLGEMTELNDVIIDLQKSMGGKLSRQTSRISESSQDEKRSGVFQRHTSRISNRSGGEKPGGKNLPAKKESPSDKLIEAEAAETGSVSYSVYGYYIKTVGVFGTVLTLLLYCLAQAGSVGSNFVLTKWSEDEDSEDEDVRNKYLFIYGGVGAFQSICLLFAMFIFAKATVNGSRTLHNKMLFNIFRLPLSFYDTTPLGRVLNRFSKDIDSIDIQLPTNIRSWFQCFILSIFTLAVIAYISPIFIAVMIPTLIVYYFIQVLYVTTSRQLKRIESVTRSPIYSHFGESIQGVETGHLSSWAKFHQRFLGELTNQLQWCRLL